MIELISKDKFYKAINEFLQETMSKEKAENQANIMVEQIIDTIASINQIISNKQSDAFTLSKKFHTLKTLLLYGDFYYESDLCQDIELELKKNKKIENAMHLYEDLLDSLVSS